MQLTTCTWPHGALLAMPYGAMFLSRLITEPPSALGWSDRQGWLDRSARSSHHLDGDLDDPVDGIVPPEQIAHRRKDGGGRTAAEGEPEEVPADARLATTQVGHGRPISALREIPLGQPVQTLGFRD